MNGLDPGTARLLVVAALAAAIRSRVADHRRRAHAQRRHDRPRGADLGPGAAAAGVVDDWSAQACGGRRGRRPGSVLTRAITTSAHAVRVVVEETGRLVRRAARRPPDASADRRVGRAAVLATAVFATGVGLPAAALVALAAWAAPIVRAATVRSRHGARLLDETPEVVDLVRLGVGSGLNVRLAVEAVVRHHDGLIARELGGVLDRVGRGERLADALDTIEPGGRGGPVQPLVDALVASERYGAPLDDALDRVAADARLARRRRREEAARRVPVKLLFPLVFCTLPAFTLLTVVPVLLRSLPSLDP